MLQHKAAFKKETAGKKIMLCFGACQFFIQTCLIFCFIMS
jgi:hypothetical protein